MSTLPVAPPRPGALLGTWPDAVLIAGSPLLALALVGAVARLAPGLGGALTASVGALILAHLVVTFVHTHGNAAIFSRHRLRFVLVPPLLLAALAASDTLLLIAVPIAVIWDVHHSGMQTFGLARLYARRAGNERGAGRSLDLVLVQATYVGPILAGAGLALHVESAGPAEATRALLERIEDPRLASWRLAALVVTGAVMVAHAAGWWLLARRGVPVSSWAMVLLGGTAAVSLVSWTFNPFGLALVTMKLFHCVQYFAVVTMAERRQVSNWLGRERLALPWTGALLLAPCLTWAAVVGLTGLDERGFGAALVVTVTLLHYWYDGFTWSAKEAS